MSTYSKRFHLSLACVVLALLLGALPRVHAQPDTPNSPPPVRSLGTLITPDSTPDPTTGFSGSLDAPGWTTTSEADGESHFAPAAPQASPDNANWDPRFGLPGIGHGIAGAGGTVYAVAAIGDELYLGGSFSEAAGIPIANIAHWDGRRWQPLGPGANGAVYGIAVGGGRVYVVGDFTAFGEVKAAGVAVWDRASGAWSALGNGLQGPKTSAGTNARVRAVAVVGEDVYIGGIQIATVDVVATTSVARWSTRTQQWSALGRGVGTTSFGNPNLEPSDVSALAAGPGGQLYVGGSFSHAGNASNLEVNGIAAWDTGSESWSAFGGGLRATGLSSGRGIARAIAVNGDSIYVAGEFTEAGGVPARGIALWIREPGFWSTPGGSLPATESLYAIKTLLAVDGALYAAGDFAAIGSVSANNIARLDAGSATWSPLGQGVSRGLTRVHALAPAVGGVYVGGKFEQAGTSAAFNVARWDQSGWSALGQGVTNDGVGGRVAAVAVNTSGQVFVGGLFSHVGGVSAQNIAVWDGGHWSALGGGANDVVDALAVRGDEVFVGGRFTQVGGISASHIASWNSANGTWSALGSGINGRVYALAVGPDGTLYAGGDFTAAGSVDAYNIAAWNPAARSWAKLGAAVTTIVGDVYALAPDAQGVFIGGSIGDVKVAGGFVTVNGLFYWNRTTDKAFRFGTGVTSQGSLGTRRGIVRALALSDDQGTLYVGGEFDKAGTVAAHGIARFSNAGWAALGDSVGGVTVPQVQAIEIVGGDVYVGGLFKVAGPVQANNIARWDTRSQSWAALGSGVGLEYDFSTGVAALEAGRDGLYVGGDFFSAGGHPATAFARWGASLPPALTVNYALGRPGSVLTLTGAGFPPNSTATIAVNGRALAPGVPTTAQGGFTFMLDTTAADQGLYVVSASVSRRVSTRFVLRPDAPLWPQDGQGLVLGVPPGIAFEPDATVYLPLAGR